VGIDAEISDYYDLGLEHDRLTAEPSLELIRTQILLTRFLPAAPARVLDVGGGGGVHANWLRVQGYDVDLLDPVPLHVEQAKALGVRARLGDARGLEEADGSYDAVLLLGPLYHLVDRDERVRALAEAHRVVRAGGVVMAAAISRYASLFEGFYREYVDAPGFTPMMREDLRSGQHRNPEKTAERFTTAYFHTPDELQTELADAGLAVEALLPVEGPLQWTPGLVQRLADPVQREVILAILAEIEGDRALLAASAHLLAVGRRPLAG
jgi:SAM-dependent methyltransferase